MIPTHVVMPVRDELALTRATCEHLLAYEDFERLWIFDNGSFDDTPSYLYHLGLADSRVIPISAGHMSIYQMWGRGVNLARNTWRSNVNIAIINNDLRMVDGTLERLSAALRADPSHWVSYPNYDRRVADGAAEAALRVTTGTYRHGGMSGFCFMLAGEHIDWTPLVNPVFGWWGGDDDIAFTIEARGGVQVRDEGLPVDHLMEGTARHHDLGEQKGKDLATVLALWGR